MTDPSALTPARPSSINESPRPAPPAASTKAPDATPRYSSKQNCADARREMIRGAATFAASVIAAAVNRCSHLRLRRGYFRRRRLSNQPSLSVFSFRPLRNRSESIIRDRRRRISFGSSHLPSTHSVSAVAICAGLVTATGFAAFCRYAERRRHRRQLERCPGRRAQPAGRQAAAQSTQPAPSAHAAFSTTTLATRSMRKPGPHHGSRQQCAQRGFKNQRIKICAIAQHVIITPPLYLRADFRFGAVLSSAALPGPAQYGRQAAAVPRGPAPLNPPCPPAAPLPTPRRTSPRCV